MNMEVNKANTVFREEKEWIWALGTIKNVDSSPLHYPKNEDIG